MPPKPTKPTPNNGRGESTTTRTTARQIAVSKAERSITAAEKLIRAKQKQQAADALAAKKKQTHKDLSDELANLLAAATALDVMPKKMSPSLPNQRSYQYSGPTINFSKLTYDTNSLSATVFIGEIHSKEFFTAYGLDVMKQKETEISRLRTAIVDRMATLSSTLDAWDHAVAKNKTLTGGSGGGSGADKGTVSGSVPAHSPIYYNVGSVTEAYHQQSSSFSAVAAVDHQGKPTKVDYAMQLWTKNNVNSKGMFQTYLSPTKTKNLEFSGTTAKKGFKRHAFQFTYNPASVNMTYNPISNVDWGGYVAGTDVVPPFSGVGQNGTITFMVVINRILDFKYYDPGTKKLYAGVDPVKLYGNHYPLPDGTNDDSGYEKSEQEKIYTHGTMYDLEYFFKTVLGFSFKTTITGEMTSDFGYIGAFPVELHLGLSLRYLVSVGSVDIQHKMFDERMVPIYSEVTFSCNRFPQPYDSTLSDAYIPAKVSTGSQLRSSL